MGDMKIINSHCFTVTNWVRSAATITVLVLCSTMAHGEDLTTLDGRLYQSITDISNYPKQVYFTCDEKRIAVAITNLPEEFREKHGLPGNSADNLKSSQTPSAVGLFPLPDDEDELSVYAYSVSETNTLTSPVQQRSWQVAFTGRTVSLASYLAKGSSTLEKIDSNTSKRITFVIGQEEQVAKALSKFKEWNEVAKKNQAEPFDKEIVTSVDNPGGSSADTARYSFSWRLDEGALVVGSSFFDEKDVDHFQELLKELPSLKEQMAQKLRNKEAQQGLFK